MDLSQRVAPASAAANVVPATSPTDEPAGPYRSELTSWLPTAGDSAFDRARAREQRLKLAAEVAADREFMDQFTSHTTFSASGWTA